MKPDATAKVRLVSDFWDYYDHHFDIGEADFVLCRKTTGGLPRQKMLEYLASLDLPVPLFGRTREVIKKMKALYSITDDNPIYKVVVHLDEYRHCGEGKVKLSLREAITKYPDHLAVEYIPSLPGGLGQTWRYLQVGTRQFLLSYTSGNDWRSNCGDVKIRVLSQESFKTHPIPYPLYAIDFVHGDTFYAIDFNIAPGIRGTGVEDILPAKEAADSIKSALLAIRGKNKKE